MVSHEFHAGDRVKVLTRCGGCYDGRTGTVLARIGDDLEPYPDSGVAPFYRIKTDSPVDIGDGTLIEEDVHPAREVFPVDTGKKNYWDVT